MRWIHRVEPTVRREDGEKMTITQFLFMPKRIGNETRWMEQVNIEQRWEKDAVFWMGKFSPGWVDVKWAS